MITPFTIYNKPIWVTLGGKIYRSNDNGKTWKQISSPTYIGEWYSPYPDKEITTKLQNAIITTNGTVFVQDATTQNFNRDGTPYTFSPYTTRTFKLINKDVNENLSDNIKWERVESGYVIYPLNSNIYFEQGNKSKNKLTQRYRIDGAQIKLEPNIQTIEGKPYPENLNVYMKYISAKEYSTGTRVIGIEDVTNDVYENTTTKSGFIMSSWKQLGTIPMKMVVASPDGILHGINMNGRYVQSSNNGKNWNTMPGSGKWIDVSSSGEVWLIGDSGVPFRLTKTLRKWTSPNNSAQADTISVM
jgi:hypothetical protein